VTAKTFNPRGAKEEETGSSPHASEPATLSGEAHTAPRVERFHTTVTERGGFRTCRRRWYLDTVQRLQHKDRVAWALIFGECIHRGLEYYYKAKSARLKRALLGFEKQWMVENERLAAQYGPFYTLIKDEWYDWREKGRKILTYYEIYDKQAEFSWDKIIEVINVEERLYIDIRDPVGDQIEGLPLLSGRPDLIVQRKDGIWVVDHKTAASPYDARALDVDDQLTGLTYLWNRISGDMPRGALYNALIKDPPKPPKVNLDGRPSRDKAQRTTYDLYIKTMQECGLKRTDEDFTEILNYLRDKKWNQFFLRDALQKNDEELDSFEERLYYEYLDMVKAQEDEQWAYPNPTQFNCGSCAVLPICQSMEEQGNVEVVKEQMYIVEEPRVVIPDNILHPNWEGV